MGKSPKSLPDGPTSAKPATITTVYQGNTMQAGGEAGLGGA
jgi:hypothetical protein